ncbi:MAG: histidinol-phosphatase [Pseudomonadota bacterium]
MTSLPDIESDLALAHRLADAAAAETLPRFRAVDLVADNKAQDGFDPVTAADKAAEAAIRAVLAKERPDDAVFGEEEARRPGRSGRTWVIDPIDGTRGFVSGIPLWTTLIALDDGIRGVLGVVDQPYIGERFVGCLIGPTGAQLHRGGLPATIATRRAERLSDATLMTTDPALFSEVETPRFEAVRTACRLTRYGADGYGYALLAAGQIDLVIESGLSAYDIAAPKVVVEAAGGVVTGWTGGDCRWGGQVLAAATPRLHAQALAMLTG